MAGVKQGSLNGAERMVSVNRVPCHCGFVRHRLNVSEMVLVDSCAKGTPGLVHVRSITLATKKAMKARAIWNEKGIL